MAEDKLKHRVGVASMLRGGLSSFMHLRSEWRRVSSAFSRH